MKNYKKFIQVGGVASGLGLVTLIYNFFNMYSLVGKCPSAQPCQAYDNWALLNKIGLAVLVIGLVVLVIGLVKRRASPGPK